MLMRPLLSVVIPFYNVEKYIAQCLDNVFNQDIPEEEYEVICVNDASPDHSRDIVLEFQKKHPNLVLVDHDVNKKLGAARNTGRRVARGKFIWNVDSDDYIVPNCLGRIVTLCESCCLDVFIFNQVCEKDGERYLEDISPWTEMNDPVSGLVFWKTQCLTHPEKICPIWNKVFRRAFLDDNSIYSPEINMGEDTPFSIESVIKARRVLASNETYYVHNKNTTSLTSSLQRTPSPLTVYENSFICGRHLNRIVRKVPWKEYRIRKSIESVDKSIVYSFIPFIHLMTEPEVLEFRHICRKGLIDNRFVFGLFGRKTMLKFLLFVFVKGRI